MTGERALQTYRTSDAARVVNTHFYQSGAERRLGERVLAINSSRLPDVITKYVCDIFT